MTTRVYASNIRTPTTLHLQRMDRAATFLTDRLATSGPLGAQKMVHVSLLELTAKAASLTLEDLYNLADDFVSAGWEAEVKSSSDEISSMIYIKEPLSAVKKRNE